jgi:predicted AAA+ superfamily ATPase
VQSGKTTLLQHIFINAYRYVSLELPDVRVAAIEDPRSFLEMHSVPVIYDEIEYAPDLLLIEKITESLAGRAATLNFLRFSRMI